MSDASNIPTPAEVAEAVAALRSKQAAATEQGVEVTENAPAEEPAPVAETSVEEGALPKDAPIDSLPESWQREIRRLRNEGKNKGARITAAEQERDAATMKIAEKERAVEAALGEAAAIRFELSKYQIAVEQGIPRELISDFVSRLRGDDEESVRQDAEYLKPIYRRGRGVDPSQGVGSANETTSVDGMFNTFLRRSIS